MVYFLGVCGGAFWHDHRLVVGASNAIDARDVKTTPGEGVMELSTLSQGVSGSIVRLQQPRISGLSVARIVSS